MRRTLFTLITLAAVACSDDLAPTPGDVDAGPPPSGTHVTTVDNADGSHTTVVDATAMDAWIGLDLETGKESEAWDLGFQRFQVRLNGGTSGDGGVELAALPDADFAAVTKAPTTGWITDTAEVLAFEANDGWYAYDPATHVLTPRAIVYVVRSAEGAYFKLAIEDYYDDAGTPAFMKLHWAAIDPPPSEDALTVPATSADAFVYLDVATGIVSIDEPAASTGWDLAFSRTTVVTNAGAAGPGVGGTRLAPEGAAYATISSATTLGYAVDALAWYDYDVSTHVVSPKPVVFLVRTATGGYAKLQITAYTDGTYTLRVAPVARDAGVHSVTVAATDAAVPVHFSLRTGAIVPEGDDWDLAIARTLIATNSGTSGTGTGGAADPAAAGLADIVTAAGTTYTVDAMLPVPGPPGSGEYSGNAVLGAWYDYDPSTHVVSPKAKAFLVRTADGGHAKLQITSYADGTLGFDFAYAGAGRDDFQVVGGMP